MLKEEGITHYNAAPTVNTLLCNDKNAERLANPVRVTVAASPPTAHLFEQMTNLNLNPVHVYGLTETYGPITKGYHMPAWDEIPVKEKYQKMARQGHGFVTSLPVRVIKTDVPYGTIVDVERDGKEIGEIAFIGNICARAYYKDAEATRKLFAGGVLHSGDLAVMHPDGAVQILDRAKDIIISGKHCDFRIHQFIADTDPRRREHFFIGIGIADSHTPRYPRMWCGGCERLALGRETKGVHYCKARCQDDRRRSDQIFEGASWYQPVHGAQRSRDRG